MAAQPVENFKKLDGILTEKRAALSKLNTALKNLETAMKGFNSLFTQLHTN